MKSKLTTEMPPAIAAFAASNATSALYVSDKQKVSQHKQIWKFFTNCSCDFSNFSFYPNVRISVVIVNNFSVTRVRTQFL